MNWDDVFNAHGYWPVRCPDHPDHAVNRDDHTGEMLCTSGHKVLPVVRDEEDRVGDALKGETPPDPFRSLGYP